MEDNINKDYALRSQTGTEGGCYDCNITSRLQSRFRSGKSSLQNPVLSRMKVQPDMALALSKHVLQTEAKNSNTVLSPLSIHAVLSLITTGSKGPTQDQLLSFLKAESIDHLNSISAELVSVLAWGSTSGGGPSLAFANGVWVDKSLPLKQSFKQVVGSVYKAASHEVDFRAKAAEVASEVNEWAEKHTNGLIKQVLPPGAIDNTTRLVFGDALYFKGYWQQKFDATATKRHDFHLLNGSSVRVPFMTSKKKQFVSQHNGFKIRTLPYSNPAQEDNRHFSMHIFLPDSRHGLPALVERAGSEPGFSTHRHTPHRQKRVGEFRIPRFKLSFGFEASNALKGLGLVLPFCNEAELTEMVDSDILGSKQLSVSSMFQKSAIEVNEEGTEAAATSLAMVSCRRVPEMIIDFVADHPFMFLVREDLTGLVLFCGHVLDPSQQQQ